MAINLADFTKIWARTSPLTPYTFSEANYEQGWNFVGSTPPARQMWDSIQKQNDEKMQWLFQGIPIGVVQAFAGTTTPSGWLLCDGSAVSRTDYADLYAVIGDTYGAGDGSTTFNLPNLTDKFIQGNSTSGTVKTAGLPNLVGEFNVQIPREASGTTSTASFGSPSGVFYRTSTSAKLRYYTTAGVTTNEIENTLGFEASRSSSIYGNSTTVQPPAITMRYIIKY